MDPNIIKPIESVVIVLGYIITRIVTYRLIDRTSRIKEIHPARGSLIKKALNLIYVVVMLSLLLLVWGIKQSDFFIFVTSLLTIVGVALFAQWSLLSNITSSIIIFFNHPVKLTDEITIMEGKDYIIDGRVKDISVFFTILETPEGEEITLPNNIFITKTIRKKKEEEKAD